MFRTRLNMIKYFKYVRKEPNTLLRDLFESFRMKIIIDARLTVFNDRDKRQMVVCPIDIMILQPGLAI